jgi:hypothetical protein
MNLVLQRGIVLTDNRRLPLQRRFPLSELSGPVDLRDGAAVGGEISRLKNGDAADKERFRQIQSTFKSLTGRDLDVRARPAGDGEAALIIEPTVTGQHAEMRSLRRCSPPAAGREVGLTPASLAFHAVQASPDMIARTIVQPEVPERWSVWPARGQTAALDPLLDIARRCATDNDWPYKSSAAKAM